MPSVWGVLTWRGRVLGGVGVALCIVAVALGQRELLWLGVALLVTVVAALALVRWSAPRDRVSRSVTPLIGPPGTIVEVRLTLRRGRRFAQPVRCFEDDVSPRLGIGPRFVLPTWGGPDERTLTYRLRSARRGRYTVGPLAVDVRDPFGLARIDYAHSSQVAVTVTPPVEELASDLIAGEGVHAGGASPHHLGIAGDDDVLVREYRHGDSMRRVHWRSTARRGELMVRREEQTWDRAAVVAIDNRRGPHAGDGPQDSFEWCVAAAASAAVSLRFGGFRAEVVDVTGPVFGTQGSQDPLVAEREVLEALTDVRLTDATSLRPLARCLASSPTRLAVVLLAQCSPDDALLLAEALGPRRQGLALVVDTPAFGRLHAGRDTTGIDVLAAKGWRIATVGRDDTLAAALGRAQRGER